MEEEKEEKNEDLNAKKKKKIQGRTFVNHGGINGAKGLVYSNNDGRNVYNEADLIVNINGEKVDPEFLEQLSKWMKENRKKKKMTQKDLAEKTGIDLKYLQKIESAKHESGLPRLDTLSRISKAFGYKGMGVSALK